MLLLQSASFFIKIVPVIFWNDPMFRASVVINWRPRTSAWDSNATIFFLLGTGDKSLTG